MKIALFGYGKMGRKISELAIKKGYSIVLKCDENNPAIKNKLSNVDVAIDFSTPDSAFDNISHALKNNIPVVSGTTAWLNKIEDIYQLCNNKNGAFLYSSNFSVGVNVFFDINRKLAKIMKKLDYKISISEIHHTQKVDTPSGTAITLHDDLIKIMNDGEIPIKSKRIDNEIGTHEVTYTSEIDKISFKHEAKNREGFALGALLSAKWILDKKGIFNFGDVLKDI